MAAGKRIFKMLDTPQEIIEKENAGIIKSFDSVIKYDNVGNAVELKSGSEKLDLQKIDKADELVSLIQKKQSL